MTVTPKTAANQRPRGRPFRPGQTGNSRGRPRKGLSLAETCRGHTDAALGALLAIMQDPRQRGQDRIKCAEIILERGHGPPPAVGEVPAATVGFDPREAQQSAREWVMAKLKRLQEVAEQQERERAAAAASQGADPAPLESHRA